MADFLVATILPTAAIGQERQNQRAGEALTDPSDIAPTGSTWKGAFVDSMRLLLLDSTRVMFQDKTRREFGGNFFHRPAPAAPLTG